MTLTLITPPAQPIVSLAEIKLQARVLHDDDDVLLAELVRAATAHLDGWRGILGLCLAPQVWEVTWDRFPCGGVRLPLGPVMEILEVGYRDAAGVAQIMPPEHYETDLTGEDGWVVPVTDWPTTGDVVNAARIRFRAGYANAAVPAPLRIAVMVMAVAWYEGRTGTDDMPPAAQSLALKFKRSRL